MFFFIDCIITCLLCNDIKKANYEINDLLHVEYPVPILSVINPSKYKIYTMYDMFYISPRIYKIKDDHDFSSLPEIGFILKIISNIKIGICDHNTLFYILKRFCQYISNPGFARYNKNKIFFHISDRLMDAVITDEKLINLYENEIFKVQVLSESFREFLLIFKEALIDHLEFNQHEIVKRYPGHRIEYEICYNVDFYIVSIIKTVDFLQKKHERHSIFANPEPRKIMFASEKIKKYATESSYALSETLNDNIETRNRSTPRVQNDEDYYHVQSGIRLHRSNKTDNIQNFSGKTSIIMPENYKFHEKTKEPSHSFRDYNHENMQPDVDASDLNIRLLNLARTQEKFSLGNDYDLQSSEDEYNFKRRRKNLLYLLSARLDQPSIDDHKPISLHSNDSGENNIEQCSYNGPDIRQSRGNILRDPKKEVSDHDSKKFDLNEENSSCKDISHNGSRDSEKQSNPVRNCHEKRPDCELTMRDKIRGQPNQAINTSNGDVPNVSNKKVTLNLPDNPDFNCESPSSNSEINEMPSENHSSSESDNSDEYGCFALCSSSATGHIKKCEKATVKHDEKEHKMEN